MWKPHWTCCREEWDAPGCTPMPHRGPFVEDWAENPSREWLWPEVKAQVYFKKKISHHWKKKLSKITDMDEGMLLEWIEMQARRIRKEDRRELNPDDAEMLCDKLWLPLMVDYSDISYHYKFEEYQNGEMTRYVTAEDGSLDVEKFVKWWFMEVHELFHKNDAPPENEGEGEQPKE